MEFTMLLIVLICLISGIACQSSFNSYSNKPIYNKECHYSIENDLSYESFDLDDFDHSQSGTHALTIARARSCFDGTYTIHFSDYGVSCYSKTRPDRFDYTFNYHSFPIILSDARSSYEAEPSPPSILPCGILTRGGDVYSSYLIHRVTERLSMDGFPEIYSGDEIVADTAEIVNTSLTYETSFGGIRAPVYFNLNSSTICTPVGTFLDAYAGFPNVDCVEQLGDVVQSVYIRALPTVASYFYTMSGVPDEVFSDGSFVPSYVRQITDSASRRLLSLESDAYSEGAQYVSDAWEQNRVYSRDVLNTFDDFLSLAVTAGEVDDALARGVFANRLVTMAQEVEMILRSSQAELFANDATSLGIGYNEFSVNPPQWAVDIVPPTVLGHVEALVRYVSPLECVDSASTEGFVVQRIRYTVIEHIVDQVNRRSDYFGDSRPLTISPEVLETCISSDSRILHARGSCNEGGQLMMISPDNIALVEFVNLTHHYCVGSCSSNYNTSEFSDPYAIHLDEDAWGVVYSYVIAAEQWTNSEPSILSPYMSCGLTYSPTTAGSEDMFTIGADLLTNDLNIVAMSIAPSFGLTDYDMLAYPYEVVRPSVDYGPLVEVLSISDGILTTSDGFLPSVFVQRLFDGDSVFFDLEGGCECDYIDDIVVHLNVSYCLCLADDELIGFSTAGFDSIELELSSVRVEYDAIYEDIGNSLVVYDLALDVVTDSVTYLNESFQLFSQAIDDAQVGLLLMAEAFTNVTEQVEALGVRLDELDDYLNDTFSAINDRMDANDFLVAQVIEDVGILTSRVDEHDIAIAFNAAENERQDAEISRNSDNIETNRQGIEENSERIDDVTERQDQAEADFLQFQDDLASGSIDVVANGASAGLINEISDVAVARSRASSRSTFDEDMSSTFKGAGVFADDVGSFVDGAVDDAIGLLDLPDFGALINDLIAAAVTIGSLLLVGVILYCVIGAALRARAKSKFESVP